MNTTNLKKNAVDIYLSAGKNPEPDEQPSISIISYSNSNSDLLISYDSLEKLDSINSLQLIGKIYPGNATFPKLSSFNKSNKKTLNKIIKVSKSQRKKIKQSESTSDSEEKYL